MPPYGWVRRWLDSKWYRYLWYRHQNLSAVVLVVLATALVVAGVSAAGMLAGGRSAADGSYVSKAETITRAVTVRERGKVSVKRVAMVRTTYGKAATVLRTQVISSPGQPPQTVVRSLVRYQPVYRRRTITVDGRAVTVDQSVTLTNDRTITADNSSTVIRTVRDDPVTVLRTTPGPTETVTRTATVTDTVVETSTLNQTVTIPVTVTDVVTETVTVPKTKP